MKRTIIMLMGALAFFLAGCEQEQPTVGQTEEGATQEQPTVGQTEEGATQEQPMVGQTEEGATQEQPMVGQTEEGATQEQPMVGQTEEGATQEQPMVGQTEEGATQEQQMAQTESPATQEEFGQSPEFGDAPETITLEAKNGNVTFPHKTHAVDLGQQCSTCHGDQTPGKIEGWTQKKAHDLCRGCHQKEGAGPTKCAECHVKG